MRQRTAVRIRSMSTAPRRPLSAVRPLDELSQEAFVSGWKSIVGEPPAAMLGSRRAMIELLVNTSGTAPDPAEARRDPEGIAGLQALRGRRGDNP